MVTYPGQFFTGVIPADPGVMALRLAEAIEALLVSFTTPIGNTQPWDVFDTNTGVATFRNSYDKVLRSQGNTDLGADTDTLVYIRLSVASATPARLFILPCSDWATSGANLTAKRRNSPVEVTIDLANANDAITWYASINEYELTFILEQNGAWDAFTFGQTMRTHVQRSHWGRCFTSGAVLAGANVQIPVPVDLTEPTGGHGGLQIGGDIWLIPMTVPGNALVTPYSPERCTITDVQPGYVEVATLVNNQPAFCAIGEDPLTTMATTNLSLTSGVTNVIFPMDENAGAGLGTSLIIRTDQGSSVNEAGLDPSSPEISKYYAFSCLAEGTSGQGPRGHFHHVHAWAYLGATINDAYRDDLDDDALDQPFPGVTTTVFVPALRREVGYVPPGVVYDGIFEDTAAAVLFDPRMPTSPPNFGANIFHGVFFEDLNFLPPDPQTIEPTGIASGEAFGVATLTVAGAAFIAINPPSDTIRGGAEVTVYGNSAFLTALHDADFKTGLPPAWTDVSSGTGQVISDRSRGIVLYGGSGASGTGAIEKASALSHFALTVQVELLGPPRGNNVPVVVLSVTNGADVATLQLQRQTDGTINVIGSVNISGLVSPAGNLRISDPGSTSVELQLVRGGEHIWGFVDDEPVMHYAPFPLGSSLIQLATANGPTATGARTRYHDFTVRSHATINDRLLTNKIDAERRHLIGNVPAAALGQVGLATLTAFGPWGLVAVPGGFEYILPPPNTVAGTTNARLQTFNDAVLDDA